MTQWDPAKKPEAGRSLYGATLRRVHKNGGRISGIIWYQGEADCDPVNVPLYVARMKKLVASFRRDFRDPALRFACVQLSRYLGPGDTAAWQSIREDQRLLPGMIKQFTTVPAIDLSLDDGIHISGRGHQVLGKRLAQAMLALAKRSKPPIALKSITLEPHAARPTKIIAEFDNVIGKLESPGRPLGFTLLSRAGVQAIFDIQLDRNRAIASAGQQPEDIAEDFQFFYGAGIDPVCNITDSAGRSLPAFGPMKVGTKPRAVTRFPATMEVSKLLPSAGQVPVLAYPRNLKALELTSRNFPERFSSVRPDFVARGSEDVLVFFRHVIKCPEAMSLNVLFGYDGAVKLWINGEERFADPDGINPAIVDRQQIPFAASAGRHEILAALASNSGRAWGIFLRFERTDVAARLVRKGPGSYPMPIPC